MGMGDGPRCTGKDKDVGGGRPAAATAAELAEVPCGCQVAVTGGCGRGGGKVCARFCCWGTLCGTKLVLDGGGERQALERGSTKKRELGSGSGLAGAIMGSLLGAVTDSE
mmetsp:Transcript_70283/g.217371  ORF Transcript_70283/g.217371 Transcript_70283/m.217371 type:complete len:110 (+) Transcript_70283:1-330(+)